MRDLRLEAEAEADLTDLDPVLEVAHRRTSPDRHLLPVKVQRILDPVNQNHVVPGHIILALLVQHILDHIILVLQGLPILVLQDQNILDWRNQQDQITLDHHTRPVLVLPIR